MALRPSSAHWFELVVPAADAPDAMEALARHGRVQFEWTGARGASDQLKDLDEPLARYRALATAYKGYWPEPVFERRCCTLPVEVSVRAEMCQIERWLEVAEPLLGRIGALHARQQTLRAWQPVLAGLSRQAPQLDLGTLVDAGPVLTGVCMLFSDSPTREPIAAAIRDAASGSGAVAIPVELDRRGALLAVVAAAEAERLCRRVHPLGGDCLSIPPWFRGPAHECATELPVRLAEIARETAVLEQDLRRLADARGLGRSAAVLERIDWFRRTARGLQCDGRDCRISGWTSVPDPGDLDRALASIGMPLSVSFVEPPRDVALPSVEQHPRWLRPFTVFTRAVGVPGVNEADPTTWVAFLVPLLFGYMCGDVGHGLVIAATGVLLRGRTVLWPLLVICGAAAVGFGFLYGDVFGYGGLIDPLWVHPLEQPLVILAAPVPFGALVLSVGLLLHTVESCWQGRGRLEVIADAAQILVYWGALLAFVDLRALWLLLIGAVLCASNRLWTERKPLALLAGLGHLVERTFSLLLNTLSFARVGAFALAHAALESAVLAISSETSNVAAKLIIVLIGNLIVVVVEGLVVSVQTSRLVMFEFFVRFFEGAGRRFEPAAQPPAGLADRTTQGAPD